MTGVRRSELRARFPKGMRPFHDLRVTGITSDAIAGANPVALMTKAGHANTATTRRYLRLAGVVFAEEADALERRLLGGRVPRPRRRRCMQSQTA